MPDPTKIYVDACPFIDMAKFRASVPLAVHPDAQKERESDVWTMKRLLEASRNNDVRIITSILTITECLFLGVEPAKIPDADTQRFFSELLLSGKSGVLITSPGLSVIEQARDLRWSKGILLKPMDSLHVATALHHRCSEILTQDKGIHMDSVRLKLEGMGLRVSYPRRTVSLPSSYAQDTLGGGLSPT